jgi:hypothetical protein
MRGMNKLPSAKRVQILSKTATMSGAETGG